MRRPVEDANLNQQKEDEQNDGHRHLTVEGRPARSADDANYFVAWIDRLIGMASTHDSYNTSEEKSVVLKLLSDAREIYRERAAR